MLPVTMETTKSNEVTTKQTKKKLKQHCWTYREKHQLLKALNVYGHLDLDKLYNSVPTKGKSKIKCAINYFWNKAKASEKKFEKDCHSKGRQSAKNRTLLPVDKWLHLLEKAQLRKKLNEIKYLPLAKAFLFISKFENHPDPVKCGGIDFRALYEMLHCLLCGYPIKAMNAPTADFVLKTFSELNHHINKQNIEKNIAFLNKIKEIKYVEGYNICKASELKSAEVCLHMLSQIKGFNPLNVPVTLLKI